METNNNAGSGRQPRLVLHLHAGQVIAECPHCKGELSAKTPIMKGDEAEMILDRNATIVAMRMATDPRPKCPHCHGRFELVIHLQNDRTLATSSAPQEPENQKQTDR